MGSRWLGAVGSVVEAESEKGEKAVAADGEGGVEQQIVTCQHCFWQGASPAEFSYRSSPAGLHTASIKAATEPPDYLRSS